MTNQAIESVILNILANFIYSIMYLIFIYLVNKQRIAQFRNFVQRNNKIVHVLVFLSAFFANLVINFLLNTTVNIFQFQFLLTILFWSIINYLSILLTAKIATIIFRSYLKDLDNLYEKKLLEKLIEDITIFDYNVIPVYEAAILIFKNIVIQNDYFFSPELIESIRKCPIIRIEGKSQKIRVSNGVFLDRNHCTSKRTIKQAKILLYSEHLKISDNTTDPFLTRFSRSNFEEIYMIIRDFGINVIVCQKEIDEQVCKILDKDEIIAVSRVKKSHMESLSHSLEGKIINDLKILTEDMIGKGENVKSIKKHGTNGIFISGCPKPLMSIIIQEKDWEEITTAERLYCKAIDYILNQKELQKEVKRFNIQEDFPFTEEVIIEGETVLIGPNLSVIEKPKRSLGNFYI